MTYTCLNEAFMNKIRIKFDLISCTCKIWNGLTFRYSINQCIVLRICIKYNILDNFLEMTGINVTLNVFLVNQNSHTKYIT